MSSSPGLLPLVNGAQNGAQSKSPNHLSAEHSASLRASLSDIGEVLQNFTSHPTQGLSAFEVSKRLATHGYNELEHHQEEPLYKKFLEQFQNPLVGLLIGSSILSLLMGQYDDAISIFAAVVIVSTVGFVQEYRSEKAIEQLTKLVPHNCRVVRDGHTAMIDAREVVPGDIVTLSLGDRVPADMRLIEVDGLEVDESSLTGETRAQKKHCDVLAGEGHLNGEVPVAERANVAFMGTLVTHGRGQGVVIGTGRFSEFGTIFEIMRDVEQRKTPLQHRMDELGTKLSQASGVLISIIILIGVIQGKNFLDMATIGVSLAVAAIPEGLPIVVTVTLALGVLRMASRNAIVKKLPAVEALGSATVICVDKTGTLTQNRMTVTNIYSPATNRTYNVLDMGTYIDRPPLTEEDSPFPTPDNPPGYLRRQGSVGMAEIASKTYATDPDFAAALRTDAALMEAARIGVVCNDATLTEDGQAVGQATDVALLKFGLNLQLGDLRSMVQRIRTVPFSSTTKFMEIVAETGAHGPSEVGPSRTSPMPPRGGSSGGNPGVGSEIRFVKGAPEIVLEMSNYYLSRLNEPVPLDQESKASIIAGMRGMANHGLRTIGVAKSMHSEDLVFMGILGISDPPKAMVQTHVAQLKKSGVRVHMLTGDSKETAMAIARSLNIFEDGDMALSGPELQAMPLDQLEQVIRKVRVFYRTTPQHKLKIVKAFQDLHEVVAMGGDGVNDAPSLKLADIGVAMGLGGTDVCKEAGDMILLDDDIGTIVHAIEEGKMIFYNIKNFLRFQLSTALAALTLVTVSTLFGYHNPLNAMQILWINIIMDGPPAQSLGVEPVDPDVMKKPPRRSTENIINRPLITRVVSAAAIIVTGTLYVFVLEMQDGEVTARDTTMTFTTFVMFDMFNALACRSANKSTFEIGFFSNNMFLYAVGGSLLGQLCVIYVPWLQDIFQTEALTLADLFFICCLTSSVWIFSEIRLLVSKRRLGTKLRQLVLPRKRHAYRPVSMSSLSGGYSGDRDRFMV
eukprot:Clim_evm16s136 gene=Clim_evmTU16s136